jgi:hypothetical protein
VVSASGALITTNTFSLAPFIAEGGAETYAAMLSRAANFGDSAFNPWGVFFVSGAINGGFAPVVVTSAFPALTFAEVSARFEQVSGGARRAFDDVWNYIIINYTDSNGTRQTLTAEENTALQDASSIATYGQREKILSLPGQATAAEAANYAQRYLAAKKDAKWQVSGPITIEMYADGGYGQLIPAAEIYSGVRMRIDDYVQDVTSRPYIGLIQRTRYTHDNQTVQVWLSQADNLAVQLARFGK